MPPTLLACALCLVQAPSPASEDAPTHDAHLSPIEVQVRAHFDRLQTSATDLAEATGQGIENDSELRRLRLLLDGGFDDEFAWRTQWDFTDRDAFLLDWWGQFELPADTRVRFGRFREAFGLESMVSSSHIVFHERSSPVDALTPGRATGVALNGRLAGGRGDWTFGVFSPSEKSDEDLHEDALHATTRWTWLVRDAEADLLHVGAGLHHRESLDETERLAARPEAHLVPNLVDTGGFAADSLDAGSLEFLWIRGAGSVQAEYLAARANRPEASDTDFAGGYLQGTWTLTGESRGYSRGKRSPKRLKVGEGIRGGGGGAWELAARYSWLDLTDAGIEGGELATWSLGVNWYASDELRVMNDWLHTSQEPSGESADLFLVRLQLAF